MTSPPQTRWLPRFGLRSMFALVLLVAVYFGSWPWLKQRVTKDVRAKAKDQMLHDLEEDGLPLAFVEAVELRGSGQLVSVAPYVLCADERVPGSTSRLPLRRRYYLWLPGWTVRLPFTGSMPQDEFNRARSTMREPLGTHLHDWGRKDASKTAAPDPP